MTGPRQRTLAAVLQTPVCPVCGDQGWVRLVRPALPLPMPCLHCASASAVAQFFRADVLPDVLRAPFDTSETETTDA